MSLHWVRGICVSLLVFLVGPTAIAQTNPAPFLYPLVPSAMAPGGPEFTVKVNGTGFVPDAVVNWNGNALSTTFLSSSQVTARVPAADIATPKTVIITVTNPAPGGGTSNPEYFQVTFPTSGVTFQDLLIAPGHFASKVVVGDFNGDGKP